MKKKKDDFDPNLSRYLEVCRRMFERFSRDNSWPWPEESNGTEPPALVESDR